MAEALTTDSLSTAASKELWWLTDHGFRYFKSFNHFRRKNANGYSYITINSVALNRKYYQLAFYLGVQITQVEAWLNQIHSRKQMINHHHQTIWNYTVNIGPASHNWSYPVNGAWTLCDFSEFSTMSKQVSEFIKQLALPFVTDQQNPASVRATLLDQPGHATNIYPYQEILAIDYLYGTRDQAEKDIMTLDERYRRYAPQPRSKFDEFVRLFRKQLP